MLLDNIQDLPARLPRDGRILGLDLGTRTIGLAVSDGARRIASPIGVIARLRLKADLAAVLDAAGQRSVCGFVLGLPVNMDGTEGPRCQATRQFARDLSGVTDLPIAFWDERWSTMAVERAMIAADLSRRKRGKAIDSAAAAYILQGALDRLSGMPAQGSGGA